MGSSQNGGPSLLDTVVAEPRDGNPEVNAALTANSRLGIKMMEQVVSLTSVCAAYLPEGHPCAEFLKDRRFDVPEVGGRTAPMEHAGYPLRGNGGM